MYVCPCFLSLICRTKGKIYPIKLIGYTNIRLLIFCRITWTFLSVCNAYILRSPRDSQEVPRENHVWIEFSHEIRVQSRSSVRRNGETRRRNYPYVTETVLRGTARRYSVSRGIKSSIQTHGDYSPLWHSSYITQNCDTVRGYSRRINELEANVLLINRKLKEALCAWGKRLAVSHRRRQRDQVVGKHRQIVCSVKMSVWNVTFYRVINRE